MKEPTLTPLDSVDEAVLRLLIQQPRAGVREYSRQLGMARATIQNRIDKFVASGAIRDFAPHLDLGQLGYPLSAYVYCTLDQRDLDAVVADIARIPVVTQADSMAGELDLVCRVVARDHDHLESISQMFLQIEGVQRIRTDIVLRHRIPFRSAQLFADSNGLFDSTPTRARTDKKA
ncbi:Lrp/AsnC family transcriptional regulator [uncultured Corynebacterium sp.]|uniref:Lrp/AsnC family transcriptional regulator n=1 Tax=uncultured Corynebacterium sp. TaxID=159447 RepID=UPI0025DA90D0|nr:Lrp/AsnC family transcriptional regulator [uncultured Corynebacterium sp.]